MTVSDEQRVVIDPSLWAERKPRLQGGGVCPAGLQPEVQTEHDCQELNLRWTDSLFLSECLIWPLNHVGFWQKLVFCDDELIG